MTDKELKSKIADIIMEAIEEYNSNEINRPMIASVYAGEIISIINSPPEEPIREELDEAGKDYGIRQGVELKPEDTYLTRTWLEKHGWMPTNNIPLFQHDPEYIDADLCVIINRKEYMIAKFHYMGDKAFDPSAMPDSFEVVGVNNRCEMLEYDNTRLVLAAFVCHLTGFEQIGNALGDVYKMMLNNKKR